MKKYLAIFRTQLINSLAYPGEMVARSLMIVMFMWIFFQLWRVTFAANGSETINGLSLKDTIWYLMLTETIELARPRPSRAIAESVRDGSIAYVLSKPYNFLLYQLSFGLGDSVFRMGLNAVLGGAIAWTLVGPPPDPRGWPMALLAVCGAWLLHFCMMAIIGLAAFITEEVAPFEWIYQKLVFILGGTLIPLDFYPQWLQNISRSLPFAYTTYGPARMFIAPDMEIFLAVLSGQVLWLVVLTSLLAGFFALGMRRLAINGG